MRVIVLLVKTNSSFLKIVRTFLTFFVVLIFSAQVNAIEVLGPQPDYLNIAPTTKFANHESVEYAHFVPNLNDGFIPQGIEKLGSKIVLSGYQKVGQFNQCFLFVSKLGTSNFERKNIKRCHHGGGLSLISDKLILLSDTRRLFVLRSLDLSVIHEVKLTGKLRGSFAVVRDGQLYLGTYAQNEADALMYQFNLSDVLNQYSLSEKQSIRAISIPLKAQGADFDNNGNLWLTSNAKSHGWLMKMNDDFVVTDKFKLVRGLEDIDVVGDNIWLVSESGAKPYQSWPQLFPAYFRVALSKLSN